MQGPHGAAYLYTHRDKLDELDPNYIGWHGVEDSVVRRLSKQEDLFGKPFNIDDAEPALDATRFEGGSWGVVSIVGAKAALEYALKHDQQERYHRVLKITDHLIDGLKKKERKIVTPLQSDRRSGIVVFEDEDPQATFSKLNRPFLGICFGHQLIGAAYGSEVVDLGHTVREFKEVKLLGSDPVFEGLPSSIRVSESHRQALTRVPQGFRLLAESATSQVEAIGHQTRPIYGLQFHPERSDEKHPHGRIILQNFLRLAAKL